MRHLKNVLTIINAESEMNIVLAEANAILVAAPMAIAA